MEKTAIVVLNYNGKSYLEKFLPFVIQYSQGHRIIVADNCSTDDSVAFLDQHFPEISVLPLAENYGYSQGYNAALAQVDAEYFVLLNSDVEVTPYWIDRMIDLLDSAPNIAAVQPKILDYNQRSRFEYAGAAGGYRSSGLRVHVYWFGQTYLKSWEDSILTFLPIWRRSTFAGAYKTTDTR